MASTKLEFDVKFNSSDDAASLQKLIQSQSGVSKCSVDADAQSVLVETTEAPHHIHRLIEQSGSASTAVLKGMGAADGSKHLGAAVSIITSTGDEADKSGVRGVARLVQLDESRCIIAATVDGLPPGEQVQVAICERGDISRGCDSCGPILDNIASSKREKAGVIVESVAADDTGRVVFRVQDEVVRVADLIGRSLVIMSSDEKVPPPPRYACGIVARSAGIFENVKRICSCSGKTIWQERREAE